MKRIICAVLLFFAANSQALANSFDESPLTPTPVNVYRAIFGGITDIAAGNEPMTEVDNILSSMFWVFNLGAFAVLVWLLALLLLQKMLVSGNDGQLKSNKYNDTMAVIRAGGSLGGLLPFIKGFCLAQIVVLFIALQASSLADQVNQAGSKYTYVNGAVSSYRPDPVKINNVINKIFDAVTCSAAMASYYAEHPDLNDEYLVSLVDTSSETTRIRNSAHFSFSYRNKDGEDLCGTVKMTVNDDQYLGAWADPTGTFGVMSPIQKYHRDRIVNAHKAAVMSTHNLLVSNLSAGVVLPNQPVNTEALVSAYNKAKRHYYTSLRAAFKAGGKDLADKWDEQIQGRFQDNVAAFTAARGWIYNGFTWLDKSRAESFMSKLSTQAPAATGPDFSELETEFLRERLDRALYINKKIKSIAHGQNINVNSNTTENVNAESSEELYDLDLDYLLESFKEQADIEYVISKFFASVVNGILVDSQFNFENYDPITNLQHLGYRMINAGWMFIFGSITIDVTAKAITSEQAADSLIREVINHITGGISEGVIAALGALVEHFVGLFLTLGPLLIAVGSVLAYWLPALPFFMWDLAVLGNYLLVIIAFMAAPLWMAAHAAPEGDGFAGEHARQGWLTMITILARPSIMVITWHVALLLMREMGKFTSLFLEYAPMANSEAFVGLWGALVMVIIYMIFELVIVYRCTSLIYEVPDQMPIYYGSNTSTANESIGDNKGQTIIAGWQNQTQSTATTGSSITASARGGFGRGKGSDKLL